jgi:hypothetical protein
VSHFAEIDDDGIVLQVIVAEQDFIDSGLVGDSSNWIQTSYNTRGGVHILGGTPLRKNFAGSGYTYDGERDAFISPKPFASWSLDEDTCMWESPVPPPDDGKIYKWNEDALSWVEIL